MKDTLSNQEIEEQLQLLASKILSDDLTEGERSQYDSLRALQTQRLKRSLMKPTKKFGLERKSKK